MLWKRVISAKYEGEDMWMTKEVTTPYGVSLWRSIRDMWDEVKSNARIKVVDGSKTRFWKDEWHEKGNLEVLFPDIYNSFGTTQYYSKMDKSGVELQFQKTIQ